MATLRLPTLARWPAASLSAYFAAVILTATVPMAVLASLLIAAEVLAGKDQLEAGLRRAGSSFAMAVEREIASSTDALVILSYSDTLQRGDVPGFFGSLTALPRLRESWSSVFLVKLDGGDILFDTGQRQGQPLGRLADRPALERLSRGGGPVLTDLISTAQGRLSTGLLVPVRVRGQQAYALGAWITPQSWHHLMVPGASANPGTVMSIIDGRSRIIARSQGPQDTGQSLPPDTRQAMGESPGGTARISLMDGQEAYGAWRRVGESSWQIIIAEPAAPLDRARMGSMAMAVGAGLMSLGAGLLMAMLIARRITVPLRQLAIHGPVRPDEPIFVQELAWLRDALRLTDRQREAARERLQAKADEFETLFENSPIGLAITQDSQCRSVLRNPALVHMLNEPQAHHPGSMPRTGWPAHQVQHQGAPLPPSEQPLQKAAATGQRQDDAELTVVHAHGGQLQIIAHAVPLLDGAGQPRGAICAYTDITERQQAEAALAIAEKALRENQHLMDLAQIAGDIGFFEQDMSSGQVVWTPGLARLFGLSLGDFEGTWKAWMERVHPNDRQALETALGQAVEAGAARATFECRILHADGQPRWLSMRVSITYGDHGQPLHMNGAAVEITQQKGLDTERAGLTEREQAARLEAERAGRAKDEFLAMLGHELRNPLGAITAAAEVLNRVPPGHKAAGRARQIITRQARHLARLMDDLLDMARMASGRIALDCQPLDLGQLARRVVGTLELSGQFAGHRLRTSIDEGVWVHADLTRLEQVIYNLLSNAIKYTPEQGSISLSVKAGPSDKALIEVRDSGVGMTPELLSQAFDLFVQGERTPDRWQGGMGIGLSLVRRLVELHGGEISAHSGGVNQGCVFLVALPAVPPGATVPAGPSSETGRKRRVVVVEDNEDAREALCAMLALDQHEVIQACDGIEGVRVILAARPDVALVDIGLPGLDGYGVARELRRQGYAGQLISVSGYGQPDDIERALLSGFDDYLIKPVDPGMLGQLLGRAVAEARMP